MDIPKAVRGFFDSEGRMKSWPAKFSKQQIALGLLAEKFEIGKEYTEREVNELLGELHTFNDPAQLRRSMIEHKLLDRTQDGRKYWRTSNNA